MARALISYTVPRSFRKPKNSLQGDSVHARGQAFHKAQSVLTKAGRRGRTPLRVGHNFLRCLSIQREDLLGFLTARTATFTNNLTEQDGRIMKSRQTISGGPRCQDGAMDFAVIRSVLSTARKQGWNMLHTLTGDSEGLIPAIRAVRTV